MNPRDVISSLKQNGSSGGRPSSYRGSPGRGGGHFNAQSRTPLARVHHQPHNSQPKQSPPAPDASAAFWDLIRKNNLPEPTFTCVNAADRKAKFPQICAKVTVGDRSWKTHPKSFSTEDEAKRCAMTIAYNDLCNGVGNLSGSLEAGQVPENQLVQRILEIVKNETTGMIDSAVIEEYIKCHKCTVPKNWIEVLFANSDKITLSQCDVHNKTIYTIFPPTPPVCEAIQPSNGDENVTSAMKTLSLDKSVPADDQAETSRVNQSFANGDANGTAPARKDIETDCESNGDMLNCLAIIPAAVPPPISINPAKDGLYFDIFCTLAANPHHFYIQSYNNILRGGVFSDLVEQMKSFYDVEENRLPILGSPVTKGVAFATRLPDGYWYRVIVESIVPDSDPLQVVCSFVDLGQIRVIKIEELQPLYSQFQKLPRQAIKSALSNVTPLNGDWSVEASLMFKDMVESKAFVSIVNQIEGSGSQLLLKLQLFDTSGSEDLDVGKMLVDKKMAKLV